MDIKVIKFKTVYATGKPPVEWVEFTSKGAIDESGKPRHTTWERVKALMPKDVMSNDDGGLKEAALRSQWAQIEPSYLAWKADETLPETGTPLTAWAGVNDDQVDVLKSVGIRTVEDLAACPEALVSRPPLPTMRELKRQAGIWMESRGGVEMAAKMADLEAQNAAMLEMMAEMRLNQEPEKRGPGRPRKEAEAA